MFLKNEEDTGRWKMFSHKKNQVTIASRERHMEFKKDEQYFITERREHTNGVVYIAQRYWRGPRLWTWNSEHDKKIWSVFIVFNKRL